jgi:hypothetical protein
VLWPCRTKVIDLEEDDEEVHVTLVIERRNRVTPTHGIVRTLCLVNITCVA